jgi:uncharacterized protein (DUF1778 family)
MTSTRERTHRRMPRAKKAEARSARLAARLSPEQKRIVERAAAINHQPVSQFMVVSTMRAAQEIIQQHDIMSLTARDSLAVMEALLHPEPAGTKLQDVAARYKAFMGQE